jgi:hypothetical protein
MRNEETIVQVDIPKRGRDGKSLIDANRWITLRLLGSKASVAQRLHRACTELLCTFPLIIWARSQSPHLVYVLRTPYYYAIRVVFGYISRYTVG